MKRSSSEGYYTFIQESPERILLTRSKHARRSAALVWSVVALVLWAVAAYSLLRPIRDMTGFIFFTLAGLGLLTAGVLSLICWTEIEFDRLEQTIIKRLIAFRQVHVLKIISFEQLKTIRQKKEYDEDGAIDLKLIDLSGKVWTTLPGYVFNSQGQKVRKKLLEFVQKALEAENQAKLQP